MAVLAQLFIRSLTRLHTYSPTHSGAAQSKKKKGLRHRITKTITRTMRNLHEKLMIQEITEYLFAKKSKRSSVYKDEEKALQVTYSLTYLLTYLLPYFLTSLLTHLLTHSLTHTLTHLLTYLSTYLG